MKSFLFVLVCFAALGCAGEPPRQPASAHAATAIASPKVASAGDPVEDRVFTLPPSVASAAPAMISTAVQLDPTCLTAFWDGNVGNCIEPSLYVVDQCEGVTYGFHYNACVRESRLDVSGLATPSLRPYSVSRSAKLDGQRTGIRTPDDGAMATAVRGRIDRSDLTMSAASFDVEVEFNDAWGPRTVHLAGTTSR